MLQRNLLYTGVTRGKKLVVLVGTTKALVIPFVWWKSPEILTLNLCTSPWVGAAALWLGNDLLAGDRDITLVHFEMCGIHL